MVAWELFLKTTHRKVKVVPQLSQRVGICVTHELSAFSDIPGPSTQSPQQPLQMMPVSLVKLVAVQVMLQMAGRESPQSMSSRLMEAQEKMFMQVLKLVMYAGLLKLALSMSYPRSTEQQSAQLQKILYMAAVREGSRAKSRVQVTFPPQMVELQLYLQPLGTWKQSANMLEQRPSKRDMLKRERKTGLVMQGMTSGKKEEIPTELLLAYSRTIKLVVKSIEEITAKDPAVRRTSNTHNTFRFSKTIRQFNYYAGRDMDAATALPSLPTPLPSTTLIVLLHSIHNYRTFMANNETSSLCNLTLEEGDLRKLDELDPFQTDGFQSVAKVSLSVGIVYTSETGKETRDVQPVTLQLLTRWMKPQVGKGKEVKTEPHLDCLKVYISSEEDIFLSMVSNASSFEALKTKNELNLHFRDFPNSLMGMLRNCGSGEGQNSAELQLSFEGTGRLVVRQHTEYKQIELAELHFTANSLEKAHQSIIFRYNYNRTKLSMLEHSIEAVYALLAAKNPPLLAYIQKTVGN